MGRRNENNNRYPFRRGWSLCVRCDGSLCGPSITGGTVFQELILSDTLVRRFPLYWLPKFVLTRTNLHNWQRLQHSHSVAFCVMKGHI
jgi:hypothetical protein